VSVRVPFLAACLSLIAAGCAGTPPPGTHPASPIRETTLVATLHGKTLDLHVARPADATTNRPLVLYASGDGGWFGAARDMWRQMASAGFTTVGFSARAFLKIERPRGSIMNPAQIGIEYGTILAQARQLLMLPPDTPAILTGWSRGASFAVLVSTEPVLRDEVIGVVAIGLAEDEDLLVNGPDDETDDDSASTPHRKLPFDNYTHLAQLPQPCAVIQATHDGYFPAAAARSRFGPDTPMRRFYAIEASNHRFSGGTAAFDDAVRESLQWIASGETTAAASR